MITALPTFNTRMMRGQTYRITRTFRDDRGNPVDLTRAIVCYAMRADIKIAPSVLLTSASVTLGALQLVGLGDGLIDTVVQAKNAPGTAVTLALVGDSGSKAGSVVEVGSATTVHYQPGVSTVADVEALLVTSTNLSVLHSGSTPTQLLDAGSAFAATNLVLPSTGYRTGVVINPDQDSYRGEYTIIIVPNDTAELVALGDDNPWLHESWIEFSAVDRRPDFTVSKIGLYPQTVVIP